MPSIIRNRFFTPIVEFHLALEQQQAFVDVIADEVKRRVKRYAGFISSSFHASKDASHYRMHHRAYEPSFRVRLIFQRTSAGCRPIHFHESALSAQAAQAMASA